MNGVARETMLAWEKTISRTQEALAAERRRLPMVNRLCASFRASGDSGLSPASVDCAPFGRIGLKS
jgi:predicted dithiol-disulfide oxidoreductase (DUF899 family)